VGALSDDAVWCLSRTSGLSREQRPRKTKIDRGSPRHTWLRHHFQGQKVKVTRPHGSPPFWRVRRLQRWAWECVGRGKLLLRCRLLGGPRSLGAHWEEGCGHIVAAAHSLFIIYSYALAQQINVTVDTLHRYL